jgi:hypothetical protein
MIEYLEINTGEKEKYILLECSMKRHSNKIAKRQW